MWINRNQRAFEWFVELLSNIEKDQTARGKNLLYNNTFLESLYLL